MVELRSMQRAGDFDNMPKREALRHSRELEKLDRNLSGIANLERVPDAIFVIDTKKEHIAVTEARKLGLPVVAVVDTNCDPDVIDYVIPGNDDAIRSGALLCRLMADAVTEGRYIRQNRPVISKQSSAPTNRAALIEEPASASGSEAPETPAEVLGDVAPEVAPDDAPQLVEVATTEPAPEAALPVGDETPEPDASSESDETTANA
jgi:small subunit ribosomal protein S2